MNLSLEGENKTGEDDRKGIRYLVALNEEVGRHF